MGQVSDFGLGHLSAQKKPCLFGLKERFTANLFLSAVCRLSRICSGRLIVAAASEGCRCIGPKQIARSLRALRNADRLGLVRGVRILLGPNACEAVLKQFASEYPANAVPSLPLPQCTSDRCQCKYVPVGSEKFRRLCAAGKPPFKSLH